MKYLAALRQIGVYMQYLIMCRSLTSAQRSAALLERKGITAHVVKAPAELTSGGCGYAVSIYSSFPQAVKLLRESNMLKGKLFRKTGNGSFEEVGG